MVAFPLQRGENNAESSKVSEEENYKFLFNSEVLAQGSKNMFLNFFFLFIGRICIFFLFALKPRFVNFFQFSSFHRFAVRTSRLYLSLLSFIFTKKYNFFLKGIRLNVFGSLLKNKFECKKKHDSYNVINFLSYKIVIMILSLNLLFQM